MKFALILFILFNTLIFETSSAQSWVQQPSGTNATLRTVFFTDANNGYAAGDSGTVLKTINGGTTWTAVNISTIDTITSLFFINADTGWAAIGDQNNNATSGEIWKTTDGASTWTQETPSTTTAKLGISFANANIGWAVGANNGNIDVNVTKDGGATWSYQSNSNIFGWLFAVQAISANYAVAVGGAYFPSVSGAGVTTTDSGSIWNQPNVNTSEFLYGVNFPTASKGFAVGDQGVIVATTDSGKTWVSQNSGTTQQLNGVSFIADTTTGWTCGDSGVILYTSNDSTWSSQSSGVSFNLNSIYAVKHAGVWAVGDTGTILFMSLITGIKDINKREANSLLIYPNPSSNETSISVNGNIDQLIPMTLVIYNTLGQQVRKIENISSSRIDLSEEGLAPGIYQVAVLSGGENIGNSKFIIYQ